MNTNQLRTLSNLICAVPRGRFVHAAWTRPAGVKAAYKGPEIIKSVYGTLRLGVDYDMVKKVREARKTGELPAENAGLPWGTWDRFPYLVAHNGNLYARFYLVPGEDDDLARLTSQWHMGDKVVSKGDVWQYLLASEKKEGGIKATFTLRLDRFTAFKAENGKINWTV